MKILYLHQYFVSRKGTTGTRSYEFGKYLVSQGHDVTMVTSGRDNDEFPCPPDKEYVEDTAEENTKQSNPMHRVTIESQSFMICT